jgi:hypothetical protein
VSENRSTLKICDLGTAIDRSDAATAHNEITPYLVSRFYRTLFEMYTGKILFTGDSNNQMLKAIMEVRGKMGGKLYRRGELWTLHFDELGNFNSHERDKLLNKVRGDLFHPSAPTYSREPTAYTHASPLTPFPVTLIHLHMHLTASFHVSPASTLDCDGLLFSAPIRGRASFFGAVRLASALCRAGHSLGPSTCILSQPFANHRCAEPAEMHARGLCRTFHTAIHSQTLDKESTAKSRGPQR